ncbi:MAG TPA: hypothetical protein VF545_13430 [Thermoleophilaceae bacterium]
MGALSSLLLAAQLPNLAGLILAAAITTVGCVAFHALQAVGRRDSPDVSMVVGGLVVAGILGALGLLLVGAGLPAFE